MTKSFEDAKLALEQATILSHPIPDAPFAITTDVLDCAQLEDGVWQPLAFFSRQLRPNEQVMLCPKFLSPGHHDNNVTWPSYQSSQRISSTSTEKATSWQTAFPGPLCKQYTWV